MGSLVFIDPRSGKEMEFQRNSDNPFYSTIKAFRESAPPTLLFLSDGLEQVARNAYVIPIDCPMSAAPAIRLEVRQSERRHAVHGYLGYFNLSSSAGFPIKMVLNQSWIGDVWENYFRRLLLDDLYCSYANHLAVNGMLGEFDHDGEESGPLEFARSSTGKPARHSDRSDPNKDEVPHLLYLKICLAWAHWEKEGISWLARTSEAMEMGICRSMDEDNFRKICIKAGLLIPRMRKGKSLPKIATIQKSPRKGRAA